MAKRRRRSRKTVKEESGSDEKKGVVALIVIVGVFAVMVWAALGLRSPENEVENTVQLPAYAYISARSEQAYRASIDPIITDGDILAKIPCYCGCKGVGHTSLKDCFLDSHGSMCDICQYEALEAYDMAKRGVPIAQIRADIDKRYGGGRFAEGTDTPPVV